MKKLKFMAKLCFICLALVSSSNYIKAQGENTYTLYVNNGTGTGNYEAETVIKIKADAADLGKEFDKWILDFGNPVVDVTSPSTTLLMPAEDVSITATYKDIQGADYVGALVPFTTYEAEDGMLEGGASIRELQIPLPSQPTVELESSGRKCVELSATGESVSWTTTEPANAIMVRVSTPDAPEGGGIESTLNIYVDGVFVKAVDITSKYSWTYGEWGDGFKHNTPSYGPPRRFFDMFRSLLGVSLQAGSKITLKKDEENTADYYIIDLIQLEEVGPPLIQPANTLSIVDFGAVANDGNDDSNALKSCISACRSQGKGLWIPKGTFKTKGLISFKGIDIYGAGVWYSENLRIVGDASVNNRHKWDLTNCTIQNLYIENPETQKGMQYGHDYGMTVQGANGWLIRNVWVHRGGACFWVSGTDGLIENCRATESWADGININNGPDGINPVKMGLRITARNNYIIGSGDDGIALNSQNGEGEEGNVADVKIINNTSIATNWANGMRIAGGRNTLMQNNLITDPSDLSGIRVGEFGSGGNPCESILLKGNVVIRGSGIRRTNYGRAGITVADGATATFEDNEIIDSFNFGVEIHSSTTTFINNVVDNSAAAGFYFKAGAVGEGVLTGNNVINLSEGVEQYLNRTIIFSQTTYPTIETNNSWQEVSAIDENLQENSNLKTIIYPNPASDYVQVITEKNFDEICVFDMCGKLIIKHKCSINAGNKTVLNITRLKSGMYILKVGNTTHKLSVK